MKIVYISAAALCVLGLVYVVYNRKGKTGEEKRTDKETKIVEDTGKTPVPDAKVEGKTPHIVKVDDKTSRPVLSETANNIVTTNAGILSKLAETTQISSANLGDYLGVVIDMAPNKVSDRSIDAYFRSIAAATSRIEAAALAYFASNAEITKAALGALKDNQSCSARTISYATTETKLNQQWEKTTSEITNAKSTGLLSAIAGCAISKNKLTKESFKSSQHTLTQMPIFTCDKVEFTESTLASLSTLQMNGLVANTVAYFKSLMQGPSVQSFFYVTEAQLEQWAAKFFAA